MKDARKIVKGAFAMMVPRTSAQMRRNDVFRWTNRLIWVAIVLLALVAVFFQSPIKS